MRLINDTIMLLTTALLLLSGSGCKGNDTAGNGEVRGDTLTSHADLLTMVDCGDYILADVKNPWDTAVSLATYALVPRDGDTPALPQGIKVIPTPVKSALVYSSVHAGVFKELGEIGSVTGVADASYYKIPEIKKGLIDGSVTDVGSSMSPNAEAIASLSPEVMLVSPFENAGHGIIEKLGIPILECADYMEATPLGRAEWIKLIGALTGNLKGADSIFNVTATLYNHLALQGKAAQSKPKVIVEQVTDGVWYLPGGNSYQARMLADAGGTYPWSDDKSAGSIQLSAEAVLDKGEDADYWFIKSYGYDLSLEMLAKNHQLNPRFKAFKDGNVYYCDTRSSTLYEEFPFHPDRLLREYILMLHPGLLKDDGQLKYYRQIH